MIFRNWENEFLKRCQGGFSIQPGRRNKAGNRLTGNLLDQGPPVCKPLTGRGEIQSEKFSLASCHVLSLEPGAKAAVAGSVTVKPAMQENLRAAFRPSANPASKG